MEIKREIIEQFKEWKNSSSRKPILLKGARQIGKTWAMQKLPYWNLTRNIILNIELDFLRSIFSIIPASWAHHPLWPAGFIISFPSFHNSTFNCESELDNIAGVCQVKEDMPISTHPLLFLDIDNRTISLLFPPCRPCAWCRYHPSQDYSRVRHWDWSIRASLI